MDLSMFFLATIMAGLFLAGAGLLAAMVVLERPSGGGAAALSPGSRPGRTRRRSRSG